MSNSFFIGYSNIAIFYYILNFSIAKYKKREWLSRMYIEYRKTVEEGKNIEKCFLRK